MSFEITTADGRNFRLDPLAGTTYAVFRESDNQQIGTANIQTQAVQASGTDAASFQQNLADLNAAKAAAGSMHRYVASNANATAPTIAAAAGPAPDAPKVTFDAAAAVVSIPNSQALRGPVTVTLPSDSTVFTAIGPNNTTIKLEYVAAKTGASAAANRVGKILVYGASRSGRGSVYGDQPSFKLSVTDDQGRTQTAKIQPPEANQGKLRNGEEKVHAVFDDINRPYINVIRQAATAATTAQAANAPGSNGWKLNDTVADELDKYGPLPAAAGGGNTTMSSLQQPGGAN